MPIINRGDDYFQAGTYTGNGSSLSISGLRFQPDFVWIKGRSGATDNTLYDSVRGVQKRLESNTTDAEVSSDGGITSFNSDGFTIGSLAQVNTNGATYAYWAWKANGTGVTNTAGSITSTVSANPTSGFSVVTFTGSGTSLSTVGHGLGVAPRMFIVKCRSTAGLSWYVYQKDVGNTKFLELNEAAAPTTFNLWEDTDPTSSVFTLSNNAAVNGSGRTFVAYCFAEVAGYSRFGSYTGNGSADGPFVYCGFRPAYVLIKRSSSTGNWVTLDAKRLGYNVDNNPLYPNLADAEGTTDLIDITSNGFKIRSTDASVNTSSGTYIFAAFAEVPFKYSLGR
jgi:hypothetical protein